MEYNQKVIRSDKINYQLLVRILSTTAGALLVISPTQYFTGHGFWDATTLQGIGVIIYIILGIIVIICGIVGAPKSVFPVFGAIALFFTLIFWLSVSQTHTTTQIGFFNLEDVFRGSSTPGLGMILDILAGIILLFLPALSKNQRQIVEEIKQQHIPEPEIKNTLGIKFCHKCGEPIIENYNFCQRCGTKLK